MINNELIEITNKDGVQTVSARDLHEKLEISERFNSWFERMLKYGFEENKDFTSVKSFTVVNNGAKKEIDEYFISLDMAKEICMIQRSEIGRKFRQYFIDCEKALSGIHFAIPSKSQQEIDNETEQNKLTKANIYLRLADKYSDNKDYSQILDAYATKAIEGKFVLPLPHLEEENYSATEVGELLGISSKKVGKIANQLNIKVDGEFGKWYVDKSPYSNKEVNTFRYSQKAIDLIKKEIA